MQKSFTINKNQWKDHLAGMELCPTMVPALNDGAGITISIALLNTEAPTQTNNHSEIDFVTNNNQCYSCRISVTQIGSGTGSIDYLTKK
jgi:hypothetical protein